jgi:uncharacterized protein
MADEKDRLGEKLHQKEKAEEDRYFAERDRELLARMRRPEQGKSLTCPRCGTALSPVVYQDVNIDQCPACQGVWLDRGELEALAPRERGK